MAYDVSISVMFTGEKFYPRDFSKLTKVHFDSFSEPGDLVKKTTRVYKFGCAHKIFDEDKLNHASEALSFVKQYYDSLRKSGVEDIIFYTHIQYYDQCNFEFDPKYLSTLGALGIRLAITCTDETDTVLDQV